MKHFIFKGETGRTPELVGVRGSRVEAVLLQDALKRGVPGAEPYYVVVTERELRKAVSA